MTARPRVSARVRRNRQVAFLATLTAVAVPVACGRIQSSSSQASTTPSAAPGAKTVTESDRRPSSPAPKSTPSVTNVYAHTRAGQFVAATRHVPYLLYVPESAGTGVDVVDPVALKVIGHYTTGLDPQHVVPSYDLKTLWSTNDLANTLTPFDPRTGRPKGPAVAVDDPYNMYFMPGGREAMVVQEAREQLGFYDAQTMAPTSVVKVDCPGVDHGDFTADEKFFVASCEFSGRLLRLDVQTHRVTGYLNIPGSSPQDVRLSPDGKVFYIADKNLGGVTILDAAQFRVVGFIKTGPDAHGIYPSRDGKRLFISNRGNGTISVLDPATRRVVATWSLPGGGSPDMGGVSPDGKSIWLTGRYDAKIYQVSTVDGHLMATVAVPMKPHGMAVWPQPGRYSLGHTGNMR
ncbi:MAG: beta-propeller repeat-containing protein [Frankiales bacterium]|nr:beta-propeller repeat-containing protein [Frankiales bacterium]